APSDEACYEIATLEAPATPGAHEHVTVFADDVGHIRRRRTAADFAILAIEREIDHAGGVILVDDIDEQIATDMARDPRRIVLAFGKGRRNLCAAVAHHGTRGPHAIVGELVGDLRRLAVIDEVAVLGDEALAGALDQHALDVVHRSDPSAFAGDGKVWWLHA